MRYMSIGGSERPTTSRISKRPMRALGPRDSMTVDRFYDDDSTPTVVIPD